MTTPKQINAPHDMQAIGQFAAETMRRLGRADLDPGECAFATGVGFRGMLEMAMADSPGSADKIAEAIARLTEAFKSGLHQQVLTVAAGQGAPTHFLGTQPVQ